MVDREGTLEDVFGAAEEHTNASPFFPTIADIGPLVEKRVIARREQQMIVAAQRDAIPLPQLDSGDVDWSNVRTADLPPGYDYSQDPHWQAGIALMTRAVETKDDLGPIGNMARELAQRMDENRGVGFQGVSKPREIVCPSCRGARYVRLGGWDGHPNDIGHPGSKFIRCGTCCPGGQYSERAERDAARKAATR